MAGLRPGEVVAGHVIQRRIGSGGSGTVYVAQHPRLPRLIALKVLDRDHVSAGVDTWRRFQREADITARFDHPNIVTVYDRGVVDEVLWISMQYIEGRDASSVRGAAPGRAVHIAGEIATALDYAHGKGVLHRDVKPSNILLAAPEDQRGERVLLTDFGIARLRDDDTVVTATGNIAATFAFASPEQMSGQPACPQSDQYSLACTLFELLSDQRPYTATNPLGWVYAHTQLAPQRLSRVRPDLPRALDDVFDRALAKNPDARFTTCTEFVAAVRAAADGVSYRGPGPAGFAPPNGQGPVRYPDRPPTPSPSGPVAFPATAVFPAAVAPPNTAPPNTAPPAPVESRRRRAHPGLVVAAVALVVAVGATAAYFALRSPADSVRPVTPGHLPADFVGSWAAKTGPSGTGDYRLTITDGQVGDTIFTLTQDIPSADLHCSYTAALGTVASPTTVTMGPTRATAGSDSGCVPASTTTLTLTTVAGSQTLKRVADSNTDYNGATYTRQ